MSGGDVLIDEAAPRSARPSKLFYLCLTELVVGPNELAEHLADHKAWLAELERDGLLLVAGPLLDDDTVSPGRG